MYGRFEVEQFKKKKKIADMKRNIDLLTILSAIALDEDEVPRKRRKVWVKDWVGRRHREGCYAKLLNELRAEEPALYRNFLRMTADQFDNLLVLVSPHIKKQDTNMRRSISAGERLALTLRYLATGDNYQSLQYLFRIPPSTISKIIPEVLDAIYNVLKGEYLQVIYYFKQQKNGIRSPISTYVQLNFFRHRKPQRLGKVLLRNIMNFGNFLTASVQWMESMWLWSHHLILAVDFITTKVRTA